MTIAEYDHLLLALTIENATLRATVKELSDKLFEIAMALGGADDAQEAG